MLEVFKEVIKGAMNPFLESSTQKHLFYIEYIDRAGNVLEQDEIILSAFPKKKKRKQKKNLLKKLKRLKKKQR